MSEAMETVPRNPSRRLPVLATASARAVASMGVRRAFGQAAPAAAVAAPQTVAGPMTLSEATSMLPGLQSAVEKTEAALKSGAKCPDVTAADLDTARVFRDQMTQFVAAGVNESTLTVQKSWLDAAGKVVQCAIQAEAAAPNTGAYVALGAIVMGGIVAFSI